MSVYKRTYRSGKISWCFVFDAPGSTRANRRQVKESGFSSKQSAVEAEARRRIEVQDAYERVKAGGVDAPLPKTLATLLEEFFADHAEKKLAPKTVERYREQARYLAPQLLAMPLSKITPLHLNREWNRLLDSGGHHRRTKQTRPLSAKTVRNIAGVVSSAFTRAIKWGLVTANPVLNSEPPPVRKKEGMVLTPAQQELVVEAATSPWCLPMFLRMSAGLGARRGEVLALRWSDIQDGRVVIARSLTQTNDRLEFKPPKNGRTRVVSLPASVLETLAEHRMKQETFREQFGADYRMDLDLIFANPDGSPLKPDSVSAIVSALFRQLKLPKGVSLHTLRHTHGSFLLATGAPLPAVSERLGHSSTYVTATIYSHAIRGQDDDLAHRWEEFLRTGTASHRVDSKIV